MQRHVFPGARVVCIHAQGVHGAMVYEGFWAARSLLGHGIWHVALPCCWKFSDLHAGGHVWRASKQHWIRDPGRFELRDNGAAFSWHAVFLQSRRPGAPDCIRFRLKLLCRDTHICWMIVLQRNLSDCMVCIYPTRKHRHYGGGPGSGLQQRAQLCDAASNWRRVNCSLFGDCGPGA